MSLFYDIIDVRLDGLLTPGSADLSLPLVFLEAQM
jgi:hypothetical protein